MTQQQIKDAIALIEAAGKPLLTLVEEFAPDIPAAVGGGMTGIVVLIGDLVTHISDIRAAINGVTLAVQQLHNEGTPAASPTIVQTPAGAPAAALHVIAENHPQTAAAHAVTDVAGAVAQQENGLPGLAQDIQ